MLEMQEGTPDEEVHRTARAHLHEVSLESGDSHGTQRAESELETREELISFDARKVRCAVGKRSALLCLDATHEAVTLKRNLTQREL